MNNSEKNMYSWVLNVKNLGRIISAEIGVSPMTLFIGDNNSGKSYLMTLIYTLLNIRWNTEGFDLCKETDEFRKCAEWIWTVFDNLSDEMTEIAITNDIQDSFQALLNRIIEKNLPKISRRGFNADIEIGSVSVELQKLDERYILIQRQKRTETEGQTFFVSFRVGKEDKYTYTRIIIDRVIVEPLISFVLEFLLKTDYKRSLIRDACYLPASRTGFLLNYRALVKASLADSYDGDAMPAGRLTRPYSDFLKNLSSISTDHLSIRYASVIQYIEDQMTYGTVKASSETPQATILYHPKETDINLPMYLSSGVITEMAPLVLMLQYQPFEILFMEEPEISLHPQLQQKIAQVLIRLSNEGLPLFITTHSDVVLQQINNMIKLKNASKSFQSKLMKQYGYEVKDLLDEMKVSVYQFDVDKESGKTRVKKLTCGPYGFEVPTFNTALEELMKQTYDLEEDEE